MNSLLAILSKSISQTLSPRTPSFPKNSATCAISKSIKKLKEDWYTLTNLKVKSIITFADTEFGLSGSLTGVLVMMGIFVSGVLQLPMGYVADRANKNVMIISGGILSTIGMLLPFWASSFYDLAIAVSIFGIGGGISMPAIMAYAIIKGDTKKAMGSVISILTVAHSLGLLTGSMAAGLAMDYLSLRLSFPCGTIIMALGTLVFWIAVDKKSFIKPAL